MYLDLLAQGELLHTKLLQKPFAQLLAQVFGLGHATIYNNIRTVTLPDLLNTCRRKRAFDSHLPT
jgi:hypothetical protein